MRYVCVHEEHATVSEVLSFPVPGGGNNCCTGRRVQQRQVCVDNLGSVCSSVPPLQPGVLGKGASRGPGGHGSAPGQTANPSHPRMSPSLLHKSLSGRERYYQGTWWGWEVQAAPSPIAGPCQWFSVSKGKSVQKSERWKVTDPRGVTQYELLPPKGLVFPRVCVSPVRTLWACLQPVHGVGEGDGVTPAWGHG